MLTIERLQEIQEQATQGIGWHNRDAVELNSAETLELVKMARRYAWLRDQAPIQSGRAPMVLNAECIPKATWRDQLMGEQLDATIDQFIEEAESDA